MSTFDCYINLSASEQTRLSADPQAAPEEGTVLYPDETAARAALKEGESTCAARIDAAESSYFKVIYYDPEFGWDAERFLEYPAAFAFAATQKTDLGEDIRVMRQVTRTFSAVGPGGVHVRAGATVNYEPHPVSSAVTLIPTPSGEETK